jgi:hypothetical protein
VTIVEAREDAERVPKDRTRGCVAILAAIVAVAALFLCAHVLVLQRSPTGTSRWLGLSPDTGEYVKMVRGGRAAAPFAFRRLVPLLASWLPLAPEAALSAITQVCVVAGHLVLVWILGGILRVRLSAMLLALASVMMSTRSLLIIQNPYIIDGFSYLAMTVMLAFFLQDRPLCFGVAAVAGVLAREDALFGALGFLTTRRRAAGAAVAVAALLAYALPRGLWGHASLMEGFVGFRQLLHGAYYVKAYFACGFLWPVGLLGLWIARGDAELRKIVPYFAVTFAGSVLSTFFAVDTTRMFLPVLPALGVACALVLHRAGDRRALLIGWLAVVLANGTLALPSVLLPGSADQLRELEDWYRQMAVPIALHQAAVLALGGLFRQAVVAKPRTE